MMICGSTHNLPMDLQSLTTASLIEHKSKLEYVALMCALENLDVPQHSGSQYQVLREEIRRRERLYRKHCTSSELDAAVADWMLVVAERDASRLLTALALGYEGGEEVDRVRINPRNFFFREIVLEMGGKRPVSVAFVPAGYLPLTWIGAHFPDMVPSPQQSAEDGQHYEVLRMAEGQAGRLEFIARSDADGADAYVTRVVVHCW